MGSPLRNVTAPVTVDLSKEELDMVNLLIATEDELMEAFTELREVLASGQRLTPRKYAKKLRAFGRALQRFDRADHGQNSIFALFDAWIQESGQRAVRSASLTLRATIGERTGPGFDAEDLVPAIETIIDTYLHLREDASETFLSAYRRLGAEPFTQAIYKDGKDEARAA